MMACNTKFTNLTTFLIFSLAFYFFTVNSTPQDFEQLNLCKQDEELEKSASESMQSAVFYVENICPCIAQRMRYKLEEGKWVRYPPEEIHPFECLILGAQSFAGVNQTIKGSVLYSCGSMNHTLEIEWHSGIAGIIYVRENETEPHYLQADDIVTQVVFSTCGPLD